MTRPGATENADDGSYLVFPSPFNRDYKDAPEPTGKAVAITFDGPVQSLYSTPAVRLGHSGLFTTGRAETWRNGAVFNARAGGKCGLFRHDFAEGRGRLILFFRTNIPARRRGSISVELVVAHPTLRWVADDKWQIEACPARPLLQVFQTPGSAAAALFSGLLRKGHWRILRA